MVDSRLSYVDTAKFLAIWFVIISHSCMKSSICYFLFAFHVQLFFMLYGFVHKTKSNQSLMEYLIVGGKLLIYRVLCCTLFYHLYFKQTFFFLPAFWRTGVFGFLVYSFNLHQRDKRI